MGPEIIQIEIERDVAIEIAITRVARIPSLPAPDLAGRIRIASKRRQPGRSHDRGENRITWSRMRIEDTMRIENKPANPCLAQHRLDALRVSAFRQPEAARSAAEAASIMIAGDQNLGAQRSGMLRQQR